MVLGWEKEVCMRESVQIFEKNKVPPFSDTLNTSTACFEFALSTVEAIEQMKNQAQSL